MPWRGILFDLDGTLVETPQSFYREYFELLCAHLADPAGPIAVRDAVRGATAAVRDEGRRAEPVGTRVLTHMAARLGRDPAGLGSAFARLYRDAYPGLGRHVRPIPGTDELVRAAHRSGAALCLASDPVFPSEQLAARLRWGGIDAGFFHWVPGSDDAHALKPQPAYYEELAAHLGLRPGECLMIGNDPVRDAAAVQAGMAVFVLDGPAHAVADRPVSQAALPPGASAVTLPDALALLAASGR